MEDVIGFEGDVAELFPTPAAFIEDLERWWNLFRGLSVAKRLQAPPSLVVGKAPLAACTETQQRPYYGREYLKLKKTLLEEKRAPKA